MSVDHALRAFPADPEQHALLFDREREHPREKLLARHDARGYERDQTPGYRVMGEALLKTHDGPEGKELRLSFFGDELEQLQLAGNDIPGFQLGVLEDSEAAAETEEWATLIVDHTSGPVFLDSPELYAGELGQEVADRLFALLSDREIISWGRDPLTLQEELPSLEALSPYRCRLWFFREDAGEWLGQGYAVNVLLNFERTGTYLAARTLEDLPVGWLSGPLSGAAGQVWLVLAPGTEGGFIDRAQKPRSEVRRVGEGCMWRRV